MKDHGIKIGLSTTNNKKNYDALEKQTRQDNMDAKEA